MWEPMSFSPRRIVYTLWSLGHGYAGIKKLAIQTNIPNTNDCEKLYKTLSKVIDTVKTVTKDTINDAAK